MGQAARGGRCHDLDRVARPASRTPQFPSNRRARPSCRALCVGGLFRRIRAGPEDSTPADANSVEAALINVLKDLPAPPAKSLAAKFNLLAAEALANTSPKRYPLADATPALINALKLPDSVKLPSMKALAGIGAAEATPALILLADNSAASAQARIAAIETIDAIARKTGALDAKAKERLDRLMLDSNIDIRRAAAIVLGANDPVDSALKRLIVNPKTIVDETVGR